MIKTQRLTLLPMTMQNLETGLASIRQLSADLDLPIVTDLMSGVAAEAIQKKLVIMRDLRTDLHLWCTYWLIVHESDHTAMGLVGFKGIPDDEGSVEIGYGINSIYQGCGYMTEAVKALVAWAFAHPECLRVTAFTHPENIASRKVLVKNGFQEIGPFGDEIKYCKTRD